MRFWKKTISILLIHAFLLSSLPAGALQPAFAAALDNTPTATKEITTNPENIIISRDYGIVKSKFTGKSDKLIIHIQDAHCNYEAQSNIAKIIESLVKNDSLSFVSVEGADGLIDTSWFKAFPDAEVRKEVANYFMKKGEITGPEFLSITTDYPIKLFGAETREYYIQNLNAFTASYPSKEETEKYLNGIKAVLNKLQSFIYNDDLKAMDAKSREHESKKIQFNEYVRFLQSEAEKHKINLRQYENLFKLINVLTYEKKIDFSVTDKERSAVIDEFSKVLPKDILTELVNKSISFKVGKIASSEYYEYLRNLAAKNGIELLKNYPNLSNYIIYNSVYSKIDNEKLFNDIKEVESVIKEKLFENEDQRTLEKLSRHIDTLLGLINIKLLNGEFDYYKTHKEEFTPESFTDFMKAKSIQFGLAYETEPPAATVADSITKLEDFYAIAIKRDKALVDNTLEGMKKADQKIAVLVTGGFHSEGMAKLLEKQGISYVVVCPNITKDVPTPYIQILTNQRTSFEDILSTPQEPVKQNMLAPALLSWTMGLKPEEFNRLFKNFAGLKDRVGDVQDAWVKEHLLLWLHKALQYMGQHRMAHDKNVLKDAYRMAIERTAQAAGRSIAEAKDTAEAIISSEVFIAAFDAAYSTLTVPAVVDIAHKAAGSDTSEEGEDIPEDENIREKTHGATLTNAVINRSMEAPGTQFLTIFDANNPSAMLNAQKINTKFADIVYDLESVIKGLEDSDIKNIVRTIEEIGFNTTEFEKAFTKENLLGVLKSGSGFKINLVQPKEEITGLKVPGIAMLRMGSNYGHYSVNNNSIYCAWGAVNALLEENTGLSRRLIVALALHELTEYAVLKKMFPGKSVADDVNSAERIVHEAAQRLEKLVVGLGSTDKVSKLDDKLAQITTEYYNEFSQRLLDIVVKNAKLNSADKGYLWSMWKQHIVRYTSSGGRKQLRIITDRKLLDSPKFDPLVDGNFLLASMLSDKERETILGAFEYSDLKNDEANAEAARQVVVTANSMDGGLGESTGRMKFLQMMAVENGLSPKVEMGAKGTDFGYFMTYKGHKVFVSIAEAKLLQLYLAATATDIAGNKKFGGINFQPLVNKDSKKSYKNLLNKVCIFDSLDPNVELKRSYKDLLEAAGVKVFDDMLEQADLPWIDMATHNITLGLDEERRQPGGHGQWGFYFLYDAYSSKPPDDGKTHVRVFYNGDNLNSRINENIAGAMVRNRWPIVKLTTIATGIDKKGGKDGVRIKKVGDKTVYIPDQMEEAEAKRAGQLEEFYGAGLEGGLGENNKQPFNTNMFYMNITLIHSVMRELMEQGLISEEKFYDIISPILIPREKEDPVTKAKGAYAPIDGAIGVAMHHFNEFFLLNTDPKVKAVLDKYGIKRMLYFVNVPRTEFFTPVKKCYDMWLQAYSDYYTKIDTGSWSLKDSEGAVTPPGFVLIEPPFEEKDTKSYWNEMQNVIDSFGHASTIQLKSLTIVGKIIAKDAKFIGTVVIENKNSQIVDLNQLRATNPELEALYSGDKAILKDVRIVINKDLSVTVEPISKDARITVNEDFSVTIEPSSTNGDVGAIRGNGEGVSAEEHGTRTLGNANYDRVKAAQEYSLNGIIARRFDSDNGNGSVVYTLSTERDYRPFMGDKKVAGINIADFNKDGEQAKLELIKRSLVGENITFYIIKGLKDKLLQSGIVPDLMFHPGVTRRAIYMDEGDFRYLLSLENGVDIIAEAVKHEKAHMKDSSATEAAVEKIAPIYNVRLAFTLRDVAQNRAKMEIENRQFEVGKEYEPGKVYQKPLPKFAKFGTSGVRWLTWDIFEQFRQAAEKVKAGKADITAQDREFARKYDVLVSNGYTQADFTMPNIGLVTKSIALYNLKKAQGLYETVSGTTDDFRKKLEEKGLLLFYDNRPGNFEYVKEMARILVSYGIKVTLNKFENKFTPVLIASMSLLIKREGYAGGLYLTASHNGDEWNGIKFNAEDGAPSMPKVTDAIGAILAEEIGREKPGYDRAKKDVEGLMADGKIAAMDATRYYVDAVLNYMGPERVEAVKQAIREKRVTFIYSAFYGSSGLAMKMLCERLGMSEETIEKNIIEIEKPGEGVYVASYEPTLEKLEVLKAKVDKVVADIKDQGGTPIVIGGSADNDADRFQVNENGEEYIPGRLTAILGHYLVTSRNLRGKDVLWGRSFVSSHYPDEVAMLFGQKTQVEPTGFKFSPSVLAKGGVIFYEESYGQSFWDWTLDKDGVLPAILALELVATTGKSLAEYEKGIKNELKAAGLLSEFHFERDDKRLPGDVKDNAVKLFKEFFNGIVVNQTTFAGKKITEKYDSAKFGGMKFVMEDGSWIALRSSGTEPVIRVYMEAKDAAAVNVLRQAALVLMALNAERSKTETAGAVEGGKKLHTPLDAKGDKALAAGFLKAGYNKEGKTANIGYGVEEGAVIDGSFATEGEGIQGYYVDKGKQFLATIKDMRDFFARRAQILGKNIKYVIKPGIGGQHTPFQGIAEVFQVIDTETGMVVGEYELGKNYEEALGKVLAGLGADWDQIAVIPSSKSGSTDETMMIFSEIFYTLLKKIAEKQGLNGEQFSDTFFNTLHDINFENGVERKGADLFKGFSLTLLTNNLKAVPGFKTDYEQVRNVFRVVLGNMFFETTDRPSQSRLAAFIKNSGLDKELGEKYAPGFGAMFDNVGGRWTADLHMMTFLAYHNMTDEEIMAYWQSRYNGINEVRNGTHLANSLAKKILDEGITDIALVVPNELFWFGKSIEQNFNESIWQEGFANLVAVKASNWEYQKANYSGKSKRLVVDITGAELDMKGCDLFKVPALYSGTAAAKTKENLAIELGRLSTTFYGTTYTVGTRLIDRALAREGYTWADVDINNLNNPATRIIQRNLYLRQPYVELGKGLLEQKMGLFQEAGPKAIQAEVANIQDDAKRGKLISNIEELGLPDNVTDMRTLAKTIFKAVKFAEKENRKFVPFIYLEGEKFYELREALVKLGIEWVMQGTGDQHISYQQVLAQPQKYLPFIISFVPEKMLPGRPAIGFAKGYLNNVSSNMVRDLFAEASYRALTEPRTDEAGQSVQGAMGIFLRLQDSQENRTMLKESFKEAITGPRVVEMTITPRAAANKPEAAREEYIYDTYVKNDAAALHQTLVGLGVNTELTKNKQVLILYDTAIDPTVDTTHVAHAGEVAVKKYMNEAIIEVRGTGKALYEAAKAQAGNLKGPYAIVTIAGDVTLREIGTEGLKDLGKVINVQNPDNRYIPVIGLYDLALRIAYDLGDEKILECLNRIATKDPNFTPFTLEDLRKGMITILPKIRPVDMAEAVEAYKAAQAALKSL
ncbi:MAG: UTP--glucose-1-phosphate uridylyltransferase [Candidatus Omnitrophica bacterium]|nr:UTP--glucose-1-phosphate uridylyltransferase [Candidatus Omnitrophota bacterium]